MTELEIRETTQAVRALEADVKPAGAWVFGGRLHDPSTATVVPAAGDDVVITDRPFAESSSPPRPAGSWPATCSAWRP